MDSEGGMKILDIQHEVMNGEDKIFVTVEGYPFSRPVFDATITDKQLETALIAWQAVQDGVDEINRQEKLKPPKEKPDISKLKDLIGKEISKPDPSR